MIVYNTLTRKKEELIPIEKGKIRMYVCGPTVYDYIHIGNARPLVVFDTMHRHLLSQGYEVKYVVNFTDIDDKIIRRANEEAVDFHEITEKYIAAFNENACGLNLLESETIHPRATEMIPEIIEFVAGLVEKGAAYDAEDAVYFDVSKAKDYGKLSRKNIEDLQAGARIQVNEKKRAPMDFALWKKQKDPSEPAWDSPWGPGRPGWHIECSTMSQTLLGTTIDVHAGGSDLQFPHHENEIAQSETLHETDFAHYWMHNSMITVSTADGEHEKMSKSKGNFFTLRDIEKEFDLILVRLWLLSAHYRSPIDFSRAVMEQTRNGYHRLINGKKRMERLLANVSEEDIHEEENSLLEAVQGCRTRFSEELDDDLNTADALASLYEVVRLANANLDEQSSRKAVETVYRQFNEMMNVLGIADRSAEESLDEQVQALIEERTEARAARDFQRADEIRDQLADMGIELKDTPTGVVWSRKA
uniref:cysteine--tRNA ligase n=1 Tax=Ndongobacter massiliensis TaxID=1871025 RepID=UPI000930F5CB|nr:cysteine--tRNA ligase [Ndongobacter massiliensis]